MVVNLMRLGLSVPISTHDEIKKLSYKRSADAGEAVTISDLYAEGVRKLCSKIDAGEDVIFPVQPRGTVRKISLRLPEDAAELIAKHAHIASNSAIVTKGAQQLIQDEG